jgi:hypothetical protein
MIGTIVTDISLGTISGVPQAAIKRLAKNKAEIMTGKFFFIFLYFLFSGSAGSRVR